MLERFSNWLDHRTGYRKLREALLIEHIPGGARWRYVWGSCLAFVFSVQLITGLLLMTAYSAGDSTAWASVYFIQYEMDFGWLIRGLHHFGSQTMVVLLGIHMLQVVIAGAHLPPREVNWWLGLCLLGCVLGLSLTGYLLPWDQKGYWATQVATKIVGNMPIAGPFMEKIIVGGPAYGHHTLSRFFTLHVGVLPPLIVVLIIAHVAVFRRHGVTTPPNATGEGWFWPDQAFRDMLMSVGVFGVMMALAVWASHGHKIDSPPGTLESASGLWDKIAHAGRAGYGVNLDAPADPASDYSARPEWYFLFLYQLLKYFEGEQEIVGTVIIPAGAGLILFSLPLLGHGRLRKFGHWAGIAAIVSLLVSVGILTMLAISDDKKNQDFQDRRRDAEVLGARAVQLAASGIPADGAINLLRRDPLIQGKALFDQNCAGCHTYKPDASEGKEASNLAGFGSEQWIRDLLKDPDSPRFFGHTKLKRMSRWVKEELADPSAEDLKELDEIARWLSAHPRGTPKESETGSPFAKGYEAFMNRCSGCHTYEPQPGEMPTDFPGPDFTGYASADWIRLMLMSPDHPHRYGDRNAMPLFRDLEGPAGEVTKEEFHRVQDLRLAQIGADDPNAEGKRKRIEETKLVHLSDLERELIIRWLVGDNRVVFGGEPISAPVK